MANDLEFTLYMGFGRLRTNPKINQNGLSINNGRMNFELENE